MKKQENLEKNRQKMVAICHGNPNNKELKKENIRNLNEFLEDQINFVTTRDSKIVELQSQKSKRNFTITREGTKLSAVKK